MTHTIKMNRIRWVRFLLIVIFGAAYIILMLILADPTRPCGIIGRYVFDSGCVRSMNHGSSVTFMPDGQRLLRENLRNIEISPINYQFWQSEKLPHDDFVEETTLSPDGKLAASITRDFEAGSTIWLWDIESKTIVQKYTFGPEISSDVRDISFSSNSDQILLVRALLQIEVIDIESWQPILVTEGQLSAAVSPDNSILATFLGQQVKLVRVPSGDFINSLELPDFSLYGVSLAFSPDGKYLAANDGTGSVYLWRLADQELVVSYHPFKEGYGPTNSSCQIGFSPDSKVLANCFHTRDNYEGFVQFINVEEGTLFNRIRVGKSSVKRPESVSFSPDGALLAVGTPDETMIFEMDNFK